MVVENANLEAAIRDGADALREVLADVAPASKRTRGRARKNAAADVIDVVATHMPREHIARGQGATPPQGNPRGGPRTAAGKGVVARNAIRSGVTSDRVPIPGIEDPAQWAAYREALVDDWDPVGAREEALAVRIAELHWRIARVAPHEAQMIAVGIERVERDFSRAAGIVNPATLAEAERRLEAARTALAGMTIEADHREIPFDVETAREAWCAVLDRDPYMPDGARDPFPLGCTAAHIFAAIAEGAKQQKVEPEDFYVVVIHRLEDAVEKREAQLAHVINEQARMRRERMLPAPTSLITNAKHEAHLNRMLTQATTELEALQARRLGAPNPVSRVHFSAGA